MLLLHLVRTFYFIFLRLQLGTCVWHFDTRLLRDSEWRSLLLHLSLNLVPVRNSMQPSVSYAILVCFLFAVRIAGHKAVMRAAAFQAVDIQKA